MGVTPVPGNLIPSPSSWDTIHTNDAHTYCASETTTQKIRQVLEIFIGSPIHYPLCKRAKNQLRQQTSLALMEAAIMETDWSVLGPLHTGYGCWLGFWRGNICSGSRSFSDSFICFLNPFLFAGLCHSALVWRLVLVFIVFCCAVFSQCPWGAWSFLGEDEGGMVYLRKSRDWSRELKEFEEREAIVKMYCMKEK